MHGTLKRLLSFNSIDGIIGYVDPQVCWLIISSYERDMKNDIHHSYRRVIHCSHISAYDDVFAFLKEENV